MPQLPPAAPTETEINAAFEVNNSATSGNLILKITEAIPSSVNITDRFSMVDQVVALFPYTAQNEDELSFLQGDVLVILDRDDPAWWRGQLKGQVSIMLFYP